MNKWKKAFQPFIDNFVSMFDWSSQPEVVVLVDTEHGAFEDAKYVRAYLLPAKSVFYAPAAYELN